MQGVFYNGCSKGSLCRKNKNKPRSSFLYWFISMDDSTQHDVQEVIKMNRANWHAIEDIQEIDFFTQSIHSSRLLIIGFFKNAKLFLHEKDARV